MSNSNSRWIFSKLQLQKTPSRKDGIDEGIELSYRQHAAGVIQEMGQRLQVSQLCINTAIVYMHRFYMIQSFKRFPKDKIGPSVLFLATKVEEQPRKLEHVIRVARVVLHHQPHGSAPPSALDTKSEEYMEKAQDIVIHETAVLQTLGFEITVDHPHSHVVKTCQLVRAHKDLAQTSYFLATNSLHLTTMCVQYTPTVVACVCIHVACKWSNWEIPKSSEGRDWWWYADQSVTSKLLDDLTQEFLNIISSCPTRLKKKILNYRNNPKLDSKESESRPPPEKRIKVEPKTPPHSASHPKASAPSTQSSSSQNPSHWHKPSSTVTLQQAPSHASSVAQRSDSPQVYSSAPSSRSGTPIAQASHIHQTSSKTHVDVKRVDSPLVAPPSIAPPSNAPPIGLASGTANVALTATSASDQAHREMKHTSYREYRERKERERMQTVVGATNSGLTKGLPRPALAAADSLDISDGFDLDSFLSTDSMPGFDKIFNDNDTQSSDEFPDLELYSLSRGDCKNEGDSNSSEVSSQSRRLPASDGGLKLNFGSGNGKQENPFHVATVDKMSSDAPRQRSVGKVDERVGGHIAGQSVAKLQQSVHSDWGGNMSDRSHSEISRIYGDKVPRFHPENRSRNHGERGDKMPRIHAEGRNKMKPRIHAEGGDKMPRIHAEGRDKVPRVHAEGGDKMPRIHAEGGDKMPGLYGDAGNKISRIHEESHDKVSVIQGDVGDKMPLTGCGDGGDSFQKFKGQISDIHQHVRMHSSDKIPPSNSNTERTAMQQRLHYDEKTAGIVSDELQTPSSSAGADPTHKKRYPVSKSHDQPTQKVPHSSQSDKLEQKKDYHHSSKPEINTKTHATSSGHFRRSDEYLKRKYPEPPTLKREAINYTSDRHHQSKDCPEQKSAESKPFLPRVPERRDKSADSGHSSQALSNPLKMREYDVGSESKKDAVVSQFISKNENNLTMERVHPTDVKHDQSMSTYVNKESLGSVVSKKGYISPDLCPPSIEPCPVIKKESNFSPYISKNLMSSPLKSKKWPNASPVKALSERPLLTDRNVEPNRSIAEMIDSIPPPGKHEMAARPSSETLEAEKQRVKQHGTSRRSSESKLDSNSSDDSVKKKMDRSGTTTITATGSSDVDVVNTTPVKKISHDRLAMMSPETQPFFGDMLQPVVRLTPIKDMDPNNESEHAAQIGSANGRRRLRSNSGNADVGSRSSTLVDPISASPETSNTRLYPGNPWVQPSSGDRQQSNADGSVELKSSGGLDVLHKPPLKMVLKASHSDTSLPRKREHHKSHKHRHEKHRDTPEMPALKLKLSLSGNTSDKYVISGDAADINADSGKRGEHKRSKHHRHHRHRESSHSSSNDTSSASPAAFSERHHASDPAKQSASATHKDIHHSSAGTSRKRNSRRDHESSSSAKVRRGEGSSSRDRHENAAAALSRAVGHGSSNIAGGEDAGTKSSAMSEELHSISQKLQEIIDVRTANMPKSPPRTSLNSSH